MKAVVYDKYGPPEVLRLQEVDKPIAKGDEVLVQIHAASVNQWDWDLLRGKPLLVRLVRIRRLAVSILCLSCHRPTNVRAGPRTDVR